MVVRETGRIGVGRHGDFVSKSRDRNVLDRVGDISDVMMLCGYNRTRTGLNAYARRRGGFTIPIPAVGEKVICLKNDHERGIYNGMIGTLKDVHEQDKDHFKICADMEGGTDFEGEVWRAQFGAERTIRAKDRHEAADMGALFDWGYAMTVHKSQGSEAKRVVLFEERLPNSSDEDWRRWLYTGVTRARERLLVIGD
jgi:exodeoxyribonuclease-5